jgi:Mg2+-importing ATPase
VQVQTVDAYGRLAPDQKSRLIKALQSRGDVVGFLGDGINDAPALKVADIGLSVDGATGVAQAAAGMILLAPDLEVVAHGVEEGRRTFANILKYVRTGASSNFGNMLSMAVASPFLPFLPMLPTQILLNNLLYDFSEIGIPFDTVRPEATGRPQIWNMCYLMRFCRYHGAVVIGLRHADVCRLAADLSCRTGGIPNRVVFRIDGNADLGDLHYPHQGPSME